jgi:type II secretory pathway pseudopilin PulG
VPDQRDTPAKRIPCRRTAGWTHIELLTVIAIVVVLVALLIPALAKVRSAQRNSSCLSTLRQIAGALHLYASDNGSRLPDPSVANLSWEQMLHSYYRGPFACPSDLELVPVFGSSYDWRDTGDSATTLAGRPLSDIGRSDAVMAFESLPGWHAKGKINVVRVDNSVQTVDEQQCFQDLKTPLDRGTARAKP